MGSASLRPSLPFLTLVEQPPHWQLYRVTPPHPISVGDLVSAGVGSPLV